MKALLALDERDRAVEELESLVKDAPDLAAAHALAGELADLDPGPGEQ